MSFMACLFRGKHIPSLMFGIKQYWRTVGSIFFLFGHKYTRLLNLTDLFSIAEEGVTERDILTDSRSYEDQTDVVEVTFVAYVTKTGEVRGRNTHVSAHVTCSPSDADRFALDGRLAPRRWAGIRPRGPELTRRPSHRQPRRVGHER